MASPLRNNELDGIHKWQVPPKDATVESRDWELPEKWFLPKEEDVWPDLMEVNQDPEADWYSPGAERLNSYWPDSAVFCHVYEYKRIDDLKHNWHLSFFGGQQILVRDGSKRQGKHGCWMHPLVPGSAHCYLAWHMVALNDPNGGIGTMLKPVVPNHTLPFTIADFVICALGIDDWQACAYEWWSPRHLYNKIPYDEASGEYALPPSVVATQITETMPLKELAATFGFWHISWHPALDRLAQEEKADLTGKDLEADKVIALVMHMLHCDELTAVKACMWRKIALLKERSVDQFEKSEDVLEVLSKDDAQSVLKKKKELAGAKVLIKELSVCIKGRIKELRKKDKHLDKQMAKYAKKDGKKIPDGPLQQKDLKALLPPGAYIWKNRTGGAWNTHVPEWRQYMSRSWAYGQRESALWLIGTLWGQWLDENGLEHDQCPIKDLEIPED